MARDERTLRRMAWGIAFLMTAVLYTLIAVRMDVRFITNDDPSIMRSLMGYESGSPAPFHIYVHGFLIRPLGWLHTIAPLFPWFTWVQLGLIFLALVIISKSLMQCFLLHGKPMWIGAGFAAAFLIAFGLGYAVHITYTQTAALLGAAAVAQMLSADFETPSGILRGMLASAALLLLAYALRQQTLLSTLPYLGLAFVYLLWDRGFARCLLPMAKALVVTIVLLAVMLGFRQWEVQHYAPAFAAWNDARIEALDHGTLEDFPPEALEAAGWDEHTHHNTKSWFFLDNDLTTESLESINAYRRSHDARTPTDLLREAKATLKATSQEDPSAFPRMAIGLFALAAAFVGALLSPGKRLRLVFVLLCALIGTGVMIAYLSLQGRLPMRAVAAVALPAIVLAFGMLPACTPHIRLSNAALCALAAFLILYSNAQISSRVPFFLDYGEPYTCIEIDDLEEYAAARPDCLFITDISLLDWDYCAFPDYPDGLSHNISAWGGWHIRSPENEALFERFGIDVWNFPPDTFLRDDVYVATLSDEAPEAMLEWLSAETGKTIGWDVYTEYGSIFITYFYEE
ncbi:MAG: hypothetical protein J6K55_10290 [Clostridia bacterium]|nr:hypothetical protein [Clostridia bacterium]